MSACVNAVRQLRRTVYRDSAWRVLQFVYVHRRNLCRSHPCMKRPCRLFVGVCKKSNDSPFLCSYSNTTQYNTTQHDTTRQANGIVKQPAEVAIQYNNHAYIHTRGGNECRMDTKQNNRSPYFSCSVWPRASIWVPWIDQSVAVASRTALTFAT